MCIVKYLSLLVLAVFLGMALYAQPADNMDAIRKNAAGWVKTYGPPETYKPASYDNRTITPGQMGLAHLFLNWMQASYSPRYAIGDLKKFANEKLTEYNQFKRAEVQSYGAYARSYIMLKQNSDGKIVPASNDNWDWTIAANQTIGRRIDLLTMPDQYFFYLHYYIDSGIAHHPHEKGDWAHMELYNFQDHPNIKQYTHFYIPKDPGSVSLRYVVLLTPDNRIPFTPVTIGEFLRKTEERLPIWYATEKATINERYSNEPNRIALESKNLEEKYVRAKTNLKRLKDKYGSRAADIAMVADNSIDMSVLTTSTSEYNDDWDIFKKRGVHSYPVYYYDAATTARCKTDKPQWIVVSWDAEGAINNDPTGLHMHQSILDNFNFDYLYKYVFAPEKVKGISYKPLHNPVGKQ